MQPSPIIQEKKWHFRRTHNTISFNNEFGDGSCVVSVDVRILQDGSFMLSYTNTYNMDSHHCHPLYKHSLMEKDSSLMNGIIVAANPITFHLIHCLMCDDSDKCLYDTGCRPFNEYCGEVMRALVELEF